MAELARDGVRLVYHEAGAGEPPIVFVHGWCCDHTYFAPQFEHFRGSHRVIAVDLRGHGASDKPEGEYAITTFADDVAWLGGQLRLDKPVIVGHSMGGVIALDVAARHPDLPSAVVLVDAPLAPPEAVRRGLGDLIQALRSPSYREAQRAFVGNALFLPTDDAERKARIQDHMASAPQHVMAPAFEGILSWNAEAAARACTVPVLSIAADMPLVDAGQLRQWCPRVVTAQTAGAGHFHQLEVPEQVNAMIERFLIVNGLHGA